MREKIIILTLDLEADHAGLVTETYQLWQKKYIQALVEVLNNQRVPLSVFVVANALDRKKYKTINWLNQAQIDFHLHLHNHSRNKQKKFSQELDLSIKNFKKCFNYRPSAYRAPVYNINIEDLAILKQHEMKLDSSCLPSIWQKPNHYFQKRSFLNNKYVKELPITVLKPFAIPNSLSWMKLLGYQNFINLFALSINLDQEKLPIIFVFHLHDLFVSHVKNQTNKFWRFIYSRNANYGLQYFENFIIYLKKHNFRFEQICNYIC